MATKNKNERKVAVLGTAASTRGAAPYDDPAWEIWGIDAKQIEVSRFDRWFELHDIRILAPAWRDHLEGIAKSGKPIYMHLPVEGIDGVVQYPTEEIVKKFGPYFLTSSIAWMMALALYEGVDEVGLWGVDMASAEEYREQRAGCRHFIDLARQMGVRVTIPMASDLARQPAPYPFNLDDPFLEKIQARRKRAEQELAAARNLRRTAEEKERTLCGRLEELEYMERYWLG